MIYCQSLQISTVTAEEEARDPLSAYVKLCEDMFSSLSQYWESVASYLVPGYSSFNNHNGTDEIQTSPAPDIPPEDAPAK